MTEQPPAWAVDALRELLLAAQTEPVFYSSPSRIMRWTRDERLSWKARGLLWYLSTLPEDGHISLAMLTERGPDAHASVRAGLNELVKHGYLDRTGRVWKITDPD